MTVNPEQGLRTESTLDGAPPEEVLGREVWPGLINSSLALNGHQRVMLAQRYRRFKGSRRLDADVVRLAMRKTQRA